MPDGSLQIFSNQTLPDQSQSKTGHNSVIHTSSQPQPQQEVMLASEQPQLILQEQPQQVLSLPTQIDAACDVRAMQSPSKNQTILRNTPKVQQQSGPIAITQPKSQVQQSYAPATEVMEVIAVSDVYVDGSPVVHGGIVICKKTLDICSNDNCGKTFQNISICLPDVGQCLAIK